MTILGWIFLTVSMLFVWGLTGWCFYKVLTVKDVEKVSPPAGRYVSPPTWPPRRLFYFGLR